MEAWLDRPLDPAPSLEDLVLRYLGAYGPAAVVDVQAWSGLTRLGEVIERLLPTLRVFRDETGRELFDLRDAPRPRADMPAPVRFLPEFDNVTIGYKDRTRMTGISPETMSGLSAPGIFRVFLVDGFIAGRWQLTRREGTATIVVEPARRLPATEVAAVADEGARLAAFLVRDAKDLRVEVR